MIPKDPLYLEEQRPSCVCKTKPLPHNGERLTGEARKEDVVWWYLTRFDLRDVSQWTLSEVCLVRITCGFVPLGGEDAPAAKLIKGKTDPAYPSK